MKSLSAFIFLLFIALTTQAQPPAIPDNGKIMGTVVDSTSNAAVEFANVALIDASTSKAVNGNVCDDQGKFTINKIASGDYILSISFIGYKTKNIKVQLTDKSNDINLGNVILTP